MTSKYHSGFICGLKESFEKRMIDYEHNTTYIRAAILDPCFTLRWCKDEAEKSILRQELKDEVEKLKLSQETNTNQNLEPPAKKKKVEKKELFSFMSAPDPVHTSFTSTEAQEYLDLPALGISTNPAKYWKNTCQKFPILSQITRDVLGVPASSAAVEHLFSIAGKIFIPQHCRLTDKRFSDLMFNE